MFRKERSMEVKSTKAGMRFLIALILSLTFVGLDSVEAPGVWAAPGDTTRVSVSSSGDQANGWSRVGTISSDGRYVAFGSDASNLVSGDTNGTGDIFVHDRQTGTTTRISVDSDGLEANGGSATPDISNDGRYVAFYSDASNLVADDTNGIGDIFVRDRQSGSTVRVSVDSSGAEANGENSEYDVSISGDGRYIAFRSEASNLVASDTNGVGDVFVHDRQTGETIRASVDSSGTEANAGSNSPNLSSDGRFVVFSSGATNLISGDTNGRADVFVHDRQSGSTTRVSVNSSGVQADGGGNTPDISGDGRYVVFRSKSDNLAPGAEEYEELVYLHDRQTGQTTLASVYTGGEIMVTGDIDQPTISNNGRYVAFAFYDKGDNDGIMNIWVHDRQTGDSSKVAQGNDSSFAPSLSSDGSLVAFWSLASNLVSGDTNDAPDVFVNEVAFGPDQNPTVVSITPECGDQIFDCPYPTPDSVAFIVIFSEQVTGVSANDFSLSMSGMLSGASIAEVSGSGTEYFVTVTTGTGDGQLDLDLIDNDSIVDSTLNPLGGVGEGNGDFTNGQLYWVDKSLPSVVSIVRTDPDPTTADAVGFTLTFNEEVSGVDPGDFTPTVTGNISGASVMEVIGSGITYEITVSTGTGDGTLRLDLIDDDSIRDQIDSPLGGTGTGNGDFVTGEVYTIVRDAPKVANILRADPSPTAAASVNFNVIFSEPVNGVDTSDFALTVTGSLSGASVTDVNGSGEIYTVSVDTGSGEGTLHLDLLDDDTITDLEGYALGGTGTGNGDYTTGETYTIDRATPSVFGILRSDPDPTTAAYVNFSVVFSEPVNGVDTGDFSLTVTGSLSGVVITNVSGSGTTYSVGVGTGNGDGTLRLNVIDNDSITDSSGYPLGGAGAGNGDYTTGETYTINRTPRRIYTTSLRSNGKNDGWVLESSENSNVGGSLNATSQEMYLGDSSQDCQYRVILHFPTHYLPDNAVITQAIVMIKGMGLVGSNPFNTHGNILVDIRYGLFRSSIFSWFTGLEVADFQNPAHRDAVGVIPNTPLANWYWTILDSSAYPYFNLRGVTQFRLRFEIDDDDNQRNDLLVVYSGNYRRLPDRPRLLIEYYLAR
jgi:hypothetical protein